MEGESQRVWTGTLAPGESLAKEETSVLGSTLPVTLGISPCDLGPQPSAFAPCPLVSNALSLGASALRFFLSASSFSLSPLSLLSIPLPASPSTSPFSLASPSLQHVLSFTHTHCPSFSQEKVLSGTQGPGQPPVWDTPACHPASRSPASWLERDTCRGFVSTYQRASGISVGSDEGAGAVFTLLEGCEEPPIMFNVEH